METLQKRLIATPDTIRGELLNAIEYLVACFTSKTDVLEILTTVRELLDSLPLSTDEYGTASNRLRNAHRYLVSQECGAAKYELRLLAGSLSDQREAVVRPRRLRSRV